MNYFILPVERTERAGKIDLFTLNVTLNSSEYLEPRMGYIYELIEVFVLTDLNVKSTFSDIHMMIRELFIYHYHGVA